MIKPLLQRFLHMESAGGILLMVATALALIAANSPLSAWYDALLNTPVQVRVGDLDINKPLLLWINDGLMALFFFLVGLELKREMLGGHLSDPRQVILPALGAVGGMAVPALVYVAFNYNDPSAINGWAIPAATDIAFALGIVALLGSRVPVSLKIFLTSLAIFDDIGAIIIIALFYTEQLSTLSMAIAGSTMLILFIMNRMGERNIAPYLLVGVVMWVAVLKSGVHATLAGVALAMFIPYKTTGESGKPLLVEIEHSLHGTVAFFILPVFAFANAGVSFAPLSLEDIAHPISLGIAAGLFLGKQLGVFAICWLAIKAGLARMPAGATWASLYGVSILCGVGFTMSLFIGSLAFDATVPGYAFQDRVGILLGSGLSAVVGYLFLRLMSRPATSDGAH